jgi:peptidoglycan-associated lipoprotein
MNLYRTKTIGSTLLLFTLAAFGCHGKSAATTPPPPPPPAASNTPAAPAPTITLRAQPSSIDRGGSTTLQWETQNASSVTITPGVGDVSTTGNRSVSPTSSVTYTATAMGPGGSATDTARITVNVPAAGVATEAPRRGADVSSTNLANDLKPIYFEYDKADIKSDQVSVLQANASLLKMNPNARVTVEGHCDERGSEEYNLALGDRRANAVKEFLLAQGIPANRIMTVSYGEERPVCREETEECFAKNRRAAFTLNQ